MPQAKLARRFVLFLPLALAACGGGASKVYKPLRYGYLEPLRLNVASIRVDDQYVPAGIPPDVSARAPESPVTILADMARDRLKPLGAAGEAVFVIKDASLIRRGDTLEGSFWVELNIYPSPGVRAAYAEARVARSESGGDGSLRDRLYALEKQLMDDMNVELEYQVRRTLHDWLVSANAAPAPVLQQNLAPGAGVATGGGVPAAPLPGAPVPAMPNPAMPSPGMPGAAPNVTYRLVPTPPPVPQ